MPPEPDYKDRHDHSPKLDKPLDQYDVIPIYQNGEFVGHVVNLNAVLKTGVFPLSPDDAYRIDWKSDDAYTKALADVEKKSITKLLSQPEIADMLQNQKTWSKDDRICWEKKLSEAVTSEMIQVPGLHQYRTVPSDNPLIPKEEEKAQDIRRLNDLASDITAGTNKLRYDCGVMSVTKGVVLQKIENKLLHDCPAEPGNWKQPLNYFVAAAGVMLDNPATVSPHGFILTPAGNVIEETVDRPGCAYYKPRIENTNSLQEFVTGRPMVTEPLGSGTIYGPQNSVEDFERARKLSELVILGKKEDGVIFTPAQLADRQRQAGFHAVQSADGQFIVVASRTAGKEDLYETKIFQKQNVGSPDEGYVLVGYKGAYANPGAKPPVQPVHFRDPLTNEDHDFRAIFERDGVRVLVNDHENFFSSSKDLQQMPGPQSNAAAAKTFDPAGGIGDGAAMKNTFALAAAGAVDCRRKEEPAMPLPQYRPDAGGDRQLKTI